MKNFRTSLLTLAVLAAMSNVLAAQERPSQPPPSSAKSSPKSDIRATKKVESEESRVDKRIDPADRTPNSPLSTSHLIEGCAAAVDELNASRTLIDALETENAALKTRIATEQRLTTVLTELNQTRKNETDALQTTVAAKNETIAAKDAVIAEQNKLVDALKTKKRSPWARIGDILIGAAVFAVLK